MSPFGSMSFRNCVKHAAYFLFAPFTESGQGFFTSPLDPKNSVMSLVFFGGKLFASFLLMTRIKSASSIVPVFRLITRCDSRRSEPNASVTALRAQSLAETESP